MNRILIIDDDEVFVRMLTEDIRDSYPDLELVTCTDPVRGLAEITPTLGLLLVDLEMPGIDGGKVLTYATRLGLSKNRIIIISGREADYLHQLFPMGSCLAVLNKYEVRQKAVLDMILGSIAKKVQAKKK